MSPLITKAFVGSGQLPETLRATAAKAGASKFEKARAGTGNPSGRTPIQETSRQPSFGTTALPQGNSVRPSPAAVLNPKLEQAGSSLAVLQNRVAAVGVPNGMEPLRGRLELLENQLRQVGSNLKAASQQNDPMQFLQLQHEIYQIDEEMELLSKMVEQATSGVKSVLQTQI